MAAYQLPTSSRLTTKPDSGPNLMAYLPPANSRLTTKLDSDANLMAAHQPPLYPLSPTVFDKSHDANPPSPYSSSPSEVDPYSSYPESVAHPPLQGAKLPTVPEHEEETPPSPSVRSPTDSEYGVETPPSPDLGLLKEPEDDVVYGPPPSPELTNPELQSGYQSSSANSQSVDLQSAIYAAKGKGKESRHISGIARDVGKCGPEGIAAY